MTGSYRCHRGDTPDHWPGGVRNTIQPSASALLSCKTLDKTLDQLFWGNSFNIEKRKHMKQKKNQLLKDERTMLDGNRRRTCPWHDTFAYPPLWNQYPGLRPSRLSPEMFRFWLPSRAYPLWGRISSGIDVRDMLEKKITGWVAWIKESILCCTCDSYGCDWKREITSFILIPKYLVKILLEIRLCHQQICENHFALINRKKQKIEAS